MKLFDLGGKPAEDKTPRTGDRRQGGSDTDYAGPDRRQGADRRGLGYGLRFQTERAVAPIEDWLERHMPAQHRLTVEGMSDDLRTKEIKVLFASADQREKFKAALGSYVRHGEFMGDFK